jgi:nucleoside-diphosphate-sugar epimerase
MRVLITGAAGFVGSHLLDKCLAEGHTTRVIIRESSDLGYLNSLKNRIEWSYGDLCDKNAVLNAAGNVDLIIHAAGRVTDRGSREQFYQANCLATRNLLNAAKVRKVPRFVFVSSPSIFADKQDHLNLDELVPYPKKFANYYAETKAISEQDVLSANCPELITCSLRPRAVWGLRDKTGFLPKLLSALKAGHLKNLAPGKRVMASICHVQNLADACLAAAVSPNVGGQAYFIADREPIVLWEFLDEVAKIFGLPAVQGSIHPTLLRILVEVINALWLLPLLKHRYSPPISHYSVGLLTLHGSYSTAKAQRDFAYDPKVGSREGMLALNKWINENGGLDEFLKHVK